MAVIEGRDQFDRLRQQHPVAEHIARHIPAARDPDRIGLHIDPHFKEVALDRKPCTLCSDPHRLVIITLRSAAGEGIVEPEIVLLGNRIGGVREGCGALISGDHEIGVFPVPDCHIGGMDHFAIDDIVGDRQQGADEQLVAFLTLSQPAVAPTSFGARRIGQLLGIEPAFGTGWNNHRVLDLLGLHQPEHFGAEIVAPIGPAQTAARHWARA